MDIGAYIAASGAVAYQSMLDTTTHDLANASTPGFKRLVSQIESIPYDPSEGKPGGAPVSFVTVSPPVRESSQGLVERTNRPLDLAIQGNGYFVVKTPQGLKPSRDGRFQLDADRVLVNPKGYPVMAANGRPVQLKGQGDILVKPNGDILLGGAKVSRIEVAREEGTPVNEGDRRVLQGYLESSNVKPIEEMVEMMEILRGYGSFMKLIEGFAELEEKMVREVGRV